MASVPKLQDWSMTKGQHTYAIQQLQTRGQDLYRHKQFTAALDCFTKVLAIVHEDEIPISVLDNRAATYAALGNLRAALSDGHKMIRLDKTSCVGYLRTGKILHLLGNYEMARDLYEMGTTKVPSNDPNFTLLQKLYEKLVLQLAPRKAVDPFQTLPLEIVEMVMHYLTFSDVCYCLLVTNAWKGLLESMPNLWKNLDLGRAKRPVPLSTVRKYVKHGKGLATRAVLPGVEYLSEGISRYITARCNGLQELIIPAGMVGATILHAVPCAVNLKSLIIGSQCQITADCVRQLLETCQELEKAEFHNVNTCVHRPALDFWCVVLPKLKTLVISSGAERGTPKRSLDISSLVAKIPNIKSLVLRSWCMPRVPPGQPRSSPDFSALYHLETLDISGLHTQQPMRFPFPSLIRRLDISKCTGPNPELRKDQFKALVWFSMAECCCMCYDGLERLLDANKGNLTHLNARRTLVCLNSLCEVIQAGYFINVVELNLDYSALNDGLGILLARYSTAIKSLSVEGTKVTGSSIATLLNGLTYDQPCILEYLNLNCCNLCGRDAVELARSKGVKTSFLFHAKDLKGRKLRDA